MAAPRAEESAKKKYRDETENHQDKTSIYNASFSRPQKLADLQWGKRFSSNQPVSDVHREQHVNTHKGKGSPITLLCDESLAMHIDYHDRAESGIGTSLCRVRYKRYRLAGDFNSHRRTIILVIEFINICRRIGGNANGISSISDVGDVDPLTVER